MKIKTGWVGMVLILILIALTSVNSNSAVSADNTHTLFLPIVTVQENFAIHTFTATSSSANTEDGIVNQITFNWHIEGAIKASLYFNVIPYEQAIAPTLYALVPSEQGQLTFRSPYTRDKRKVGVSLSIENEDGETATVERTVTFACEHPFINPDYALSGYCPSEAYVTNSAFQLFEGGYMLWLNGNAPSVMVFYTSTAPYQSGTYITFEDSWDDSQPLDDPTLSPPVGMFQPIRGFGKVWRENPEVRDKLGWATRPEQAYAPTRTQFLQTSPRDYSRWIEVIEGHYIVTRLTKDFRRLWNFSGESLTE